MFILQNLAYIHPNKELLFNNIDLVVNNHEKIALLGNNGIGKSTLLKIIAGELQPSSGVLNINMKPYYVPQVFGQYNHITVAQALHIEDKLKALHEIIAGNVTEYNMYLLDDDWTIEERLKEALQYWKIDELNLYQPLSTLSGGQKTKLFLAGIFINNPELVLLDEPSNHLDNEGRQLLYDYIQTTSTTLIVVSHDRKLLNLLNVVCELNTNGIVTYGGNYDFYADQKSIEQNAFHEDVKSKEKALRKAKEKERTIKERRQKLDAKGRKKQEKAGMPTIVMHSLRNNAERSTSKLKDIHAEKINGLVNELQALRKILPGIDTMRFEFDDATLHEGKILFRAKNINFNYGNGLLWQQNLDVEITSGERIALKGLNGSGKTTLIKIILGVSNVSTGTVYSAIDNAVYIDQDYSLINNQLSVYEQAQLFNKSLLQENEIKNRLNRFLFSKEFWDKSCSSLSGGERMRLMLCCLAIGNHAPDVIVLDEPTNNLDIQNTEILTTVINEYKGTLIVVSHDEYFLDGINVHRVISL